MITQWVTVFRGPMWEALALQAKLEAHGVPAFLPEANIKTIDPFITGADAFGVSLQVPGDAVEEARELLLTERESGRALLATPEGEEQTSSAELEIARLGARLRFAGLFALVCFPFGLWAIPLGYDYCKLVRRTGIRPRGHRYNLAAYGAGILGLIGPAVLFWMFWISYLQRLEQ